MVKSETGGPLKGSAGKLPPHQPPPADGQQQQFRPIEMISATLAATRGEDGARHASVKFYSGATVDRMDYWSGERYKLRFSLDPGAMRMERVDNGNCPVLKDHLSFWLDAQVGKVDKAWIEGGSARADLRFSQRDEVTPIWRDVEDDILSSVSMGVYIHKLADVTPDDDKVKTYEATDWELVEISLVSVPADAAVGFLSAQLGRIDLSKAEIIPRATEQPGEQPARAEAQIQEEKLTMINTTQGGAGADTSAAPPPNPTTPATINATETQLAAAREAAIAEERARMAEIRKRVKAANLGDDLYETLASEGVTLEVATSRIFEAMANRSAQVPTNPHHQQAQITHDETDKFRDSVRVALLHRYDPAKNKHHDGSRRFVGMSLIELARECVRRAGKDHFGSPSAVAELAMHGTTDFPYILENVANKSLRQAYEQAPRTFKPFCRQGSAKDFKLMSRVMLGEAPKLEEVPESGEFKRGTITEGKETYRVSTFGKVIAITRQAIINDDLQAFTRVPELFGRAAANLESDTVWGIITTNGNMADSVALFHATHNNLISGGGSALALAGLAAGRAAMRKQKGLDGATLLNLIPQFLVVPAALETTANQLTVQVTAPTSSAVVVPEWVRSLSPIVEPRLDANSAAAWYLFADPNQVDTIEYAYLEGQEGVYTEVKNGFDVDGIEIKARHDFGAKALDHRGMQKNAGS